LYTDLEHTAQGQFFRSIMHDPPMSSTRGDMPLEMNQNSPTSLREVLVLRLWRSSQRENWVGEIQNVETGQINYVNSPEQLFKITLELMGSEAEQARLAGKV
jgi:hypothetical protein